MPTCFGRRYVRAKPGPIEVAVGVVILLLLAGVVVLFVTVSLQPGEALFEVKPGSEQPSDTTPIRHLVAEARGDKPPFPEVPGLDWLPPDNTRVFTPANLWEKIDGRADLYLNFGMLTMTFGTYQLANDPSTFIDVYWYDLGSPEGALGVFRAEYGGRVTPVDVGREGYISGGSVFFFKGSHYLRIEAPEDSETYGEASRAIARAIAATISDDGGKMWADALFLKEGRLPGSFEYHAESAFGLDFLSAIFSADYDIDGRRVTLFVHRAESEEAAAKMFDDYVSFFAEYGSVAQHPTEDRRFLIGESGSVYDAVFQTGKYVGGSTGADNADAAQEHARMFQESLNSSSLTSG